MSEQEARTFHAERHAPHGFPQRFEDCYGTPCAMFTRHIGRPTRKNRGLGK